MIDKAILRQKAGEFIWELELYKGDDLVRTIMGERFYFDVKEDYISFYDHGGNGQGMPRTWGALLFRCPMPPTFEVITPTADEALEYEQKQKADEARREVEEKEKKQKWDALPEAEKEKRRLQSQISLCQLNVSVWKMTHPDTYLTFDHVQKELKEKAKLEKELSNYD